MLKACAYSCTDFLMRHTNIASSRRPIYLYGFELLLSTFTFYHCYFDFSAYS